MNNTSLRLGSKWVETADGEYITDEVLQKLSTYREGIRVQMKDGFYATLVQSIVTGKLYLNYQKETQMVTQIQININHPHDLNLKSIHIYNANF